MALGDAEAELNLPPGFRFHPTDEELVVNYLARKVAGLKLPVAIIAEVDLYKFDPWNLPEKALFGQKEWYFFTPRDRKYPNGSRPNRAAGRGYWKATGADKPVTPKGSARQVGIKKALVFYSGKAPRGIKTDWIMHEYRLAVDHKSPSKNGNQRLDEWVLCRLYNKKNTWDRNQKITVPEQISAPRMAVRQEASYSEQHNSFGDSESFHESEIDNTEMRSNGHTEMKIKEDNEWFMGLNLDDLQNPYANFGSGLNVPAPLQVPAGQEYYLSAVNSPHMKFNQSNFMPF